MINQNNDLEKEYAQLQEQIKMQEELQEIENQKNKELKSCLQEMKELGEKLKKDPSYIKHGYVVKQDLINVYKNDENNSSDDDVLLMIQAPQGSTLDIPLEQYQEHVMHQ